MAGPGLQQSMGTAARLLSARLLLTAHGHGLGSGVSPAKSTGRCQLYWQRQGREREPRAKGNWHLALGHQVGVCWGKVKLRAEPRGALGTHSEEDEHRHAGHRWEPSSPQELRRNVWV